MKGIPKVPQPAKRRRGVTLIEAVLYISVALALIVGGLVFYQQAAFQSRMNSVVRTYSALIAEARTVTGEGFSIEGDAGSYFEDLLYARGAIPAELWDATKPSGERLRLPFPNMSATLAVGLAADGTSTITLFQQNMPVSLCSRLFVASRRDTRYANGALTAIFSDALGGPPAAVHSYFVFPSVTPEQSGTYCRSADVNGNGLVSTQITFRTSD